MEQRARIREAAPVDLKFGQNGRDRIVFLFSPGPENQCARRTRNRETDHCALKNAVPEKTRVANEFWVREVMPFCPKKPIQLSLETCSAQELDDCLKFYFGLRTKDEYVYQRSSYVSARSAIQRQLATFKRPFNLRSSEEFQNSNSVLDADLEDVLTDSTGQGWNVPWKYQAASTVLRQRKLCVHRSKLSEAVAPQEIHPAPIISFPIDHLHNYCLG